MKVNVNTKEFKSLSEEELASLIKKVVENPEQYEEEAKLILVLELEDVQGAVVDIWERVSIVQGDADIITLEWTEEEGPPTRKFRKIAIIPKMVPTIIERIVHHDDSSRFEHYSIIYIFTGEKWVSVTTNPQ